MGVNSLPKTVTRQRRGCDLNPGPSAPESRTLTTRLPSHPRGPVEDRLVASDTASDAADPLYNCRRARDACRGARGGSRAKRDDD